MKLLYITVLVIAVLGLAVFLIKDTESQDIDKQCIDAGYIPPRNYFQLSQ